MVRGNCDYVFLQPIYSKSQRDTLFDMEAVNMDKATWELLMDEIIHRELLPGNTAQDPKKKVRIMVCFHFTPVPIKMLPKFRLCHPKYWDKSLMKKKSLFGKQDKEHIPLSLTQIEAKLNKL